MTALLAALKAQPDSTALVSDPAEVNRRYRYWRVRILSASLVGYAIYYFVRTNISVALPAMQKDLGYSKAQLGIILSVGGVVYGVSKFANGFLGDRANPRYFMPLGLLLCAAANVLFGLSSAIPVLAAFWFMNNWAQGMGFPPCARNMGYWFSPKERGTTFGIWHTGHTAGAALVAVLTGYILHRTGNWRLCFFVPAGIAVAGAVMLLLRLRDTPGSMGLPPVEVWKGEETRAELAKELHSAEPLVQAAPDAVAGAADAGGSGENASAKTRRREGSREEERRSGEGEAPAEPGAGCADDPRLGRSLALPCSFLRGFACFALAFQLTSGGRSACPQIAKTLPSRPWSSSACPPGSSSPACCPPARPAAASSPPRTPARPAACRPARRP